MFPNPPNFAFAASPIIISPHPQGARAPATSPQGEEKMDTTGMNGVFMVLKNMGIYCNGE